MKRNYITIAHSLTSTVYILILLEVKAVILKKEIRGTRQLIHFGSQYPSQGQCVEF